VTEDDRDRLIDEFITLIASTPGDGANQGEDA